MQKKRDEERPHCIMLAYAPMNDRLMKNDSIRPLGSAEFS